jgi:hypothetical protein
MTLPDERRLAVGDRVLCTAVEKAGTITVLWPNGAAYVRCDDDQLVACGVEVLARSLDHAATSTSGPHAGTAPRRVRQAPSAQSSAARRGRRWAGPEDVEVVNGGERVVDGRGLCA